MNQQGDSRTQLHTNTNNVPRGVDTNTGLDNGRRPQDQLATAFRNEGAIQTQPASQNEVAIQKQPAPPPPPPPPPPPQDQGAIQTQATPPTPPQFRLRPPSPPPLLPQNQRTLQSQHSPGNITSERVPYGYDKEEQKRIWKNRCLICGRARHDHWKQCDRECYHCREHLGIRGPNVHVGMPCPNTGFNSRWWKDVGGGPIGETNWNKLRVQSLERLLQQKDKKIQKKDKEILQKDEALRRRKEKIIELEGDLDSAKYYIAHELGAVKKESTMQSSQEHIKRLKSELQAAKAMEPAMSNPSRNYREREDSLRSRSHTRGNHDERKGRQQSPRHRARHPARSPSRPPDNDAEYQEFLKFKEFQKRAMREGHHDYKASRKSENRSKSPSRERIPYDSDADKEPMKRSAYLDGPNSPPIREYYAPTIAQPDPRTHIFRSGARSQTAFGEQRPYHQQAARGQSPPTLGNYSASDRQSLPRFNEPLMRNQRSSQSHRQPSRPVVEDDDTFMGGAVMTIRKVE